MIVAKSRDGWGVAIDSDVVQEFGALEDALAHAEELCAALRLEGDQAEVLDLSEAVTPGVLMPRRGTD